MTNRLKARHGSGSVFPCPGGWKYSVSVPGRKRITRRARTREQAERLRDQLLRTMPRQPGQLWDSTLSQLICTWVSTLDALPATKASYLRALQHLEDLTDVRICDLTPVALDLWLAKLKAKYRLGSRTVQNAGHVVQRSLDYAVRLGVLGEGPFKGKVPSFRRKEIRPFTAEEATRIVQESLMEPDGGVIVLAFLAGLRQGESLGLQWGSVLWESSRLVIERQAVQEGGKVSIRQPKTQASIRVIQVPQVVMRMLQRLYEKAQASNRAEPSDFVFSNDNGGPISRLDFTRCTWKPLLKRLGIGHRGAHHGRHYCASVLLQNGTPIVEVASYLGHRNAGFTLSIYAHLIARGGSVAAATLDRVFGDLEQERGE